MAARLKLLPARPKKCADLLRYEDALFAQFALQASQKPRYRVGGWAAGMHNVGATNTREVFRFYAEAKAALLGRQIVHDETSWAKEFAFPWGGQLNYPTFLRASEGRPMLFYKAVQVIATFEAYSLHKGGGDIYTVMDIIPCSYNIDRFNSGLLSDLRNGRFGQHSESFDDSALKATVQTNPELFDRMANGECVTKETAERLHAHVLRIFEEASVPANTIGPVRPYQGKKTLGRRAASEMEIVDTDSPRPIGTV